MFVISPTTNWNTNEMLQNLHFKIPWDVSKTDRSNSKAKGLQMSFYV